MLPISPSVSLPVTLDFLPGVTFHVRPASVRDKLRWRQAIVAAGAVFVGESAVRAAALAGIDAVVVEDQRAAVRARLTEWFETPEDERAGNPQLGRDVEEIGRALRQHWPPYAALEADRQFWSDTASFVAFGLFVAGWEGLPQTYCQVNGRVPDDLVDQLDLRVVMAIGNRAIALFAPTQADEKNSASPPPSAEPPAPSQPAIAPPTAADGSSTASITS